MILSENKLIVAGTYHPTKLFYTYCITCTNLENSPLLIYKYLIASMGYVLEICAYINNGFAH